MSRNYNAEERSGFLRNFVLSAQITQLQLILDSSSSIMFIVKFLAFFAPLILVCLDLLTLIRFNEGLEKIDVSTAKIVLLYKYKH